MSNHRVHGRIHDLRPAGITGPTQVVSSHPLRIIPVNDDHHVYIGARLGLSSSIGPVKDHLSDALREPPEKPPLEVRQGSRDIGRKHLG